jgi:hypothetical protein
MMGSTQNRSLTVAARIGTLRLGSEPRPLRERSSGGLMRNLWH